MLMKYKDFKTMTNAEMKNVMGGNAPLGGSGACSASYECPSGGTIQCSGVDGDVNNGGCQVVGSSVSCRQTDGNYTAVSCNGIS